MGSPRVDQAIDRVKDQILSGALNPGDKLPAEEDLAKQLEVSRNSLREAVRALQAMRILEVRQGDGTYVSALEPAAMMDVLRFVVDVSDAQSVVWFLELRRILEVSSIKMAAARRTLDQLKMLKDLHAQFLEEEDIETLMLLDSSFHHLIAEIGANPVIAALLRVAGPTGLARIWRSHLSGGDFEETRLDHALIIEAIEAQDVSSAGNAMWTHLSRLIGWVREHPDALGHQKD